MALSDRFNFSDLDLPRLTAAGLKLSQIFALRNQGYTTETMLTYAQTGRKPSTGELEAEREQRAARDYQRRRGLNTAVRREAQDLGKLPTNKIRESPKVLPPPAGPQLPFGFGPLAARSYYLTPDEIRSMQIKTGRTISDDAIAKINADITYYHFQKLSPEQQKQPNAMGNLIAGLTRAGTEISKNIRLGAIPQPGLLSMHPIEESKKGRLWSKKYLSIDVENDTILGPGNLPSTILRSIGATWQQYNAQTGQVRNVGKPFYIELNAKDMPIYDSYLSLHHLPADKGVSRNGAAAIRGRRKLQAMLDEAGGRVAGHWVATDLKKLEHEGWIDRKKVTAVLDTMFEDSRQNQFIPFRKLEDVAGPVRDIGFGANRPSAAAHNAFYDAAHLERNAIENIAANSPDVMANFLNTRYSSVREYDAAKQQFDAAEAVAERWKAGEVVGLPPGWTPPKDVKIDEARQIAEDATKVSHFELPDIADLPDGFSLVDEKSKINKDTSEIVLAEKNKISTEASKLLGDYGAGRPNNIKPGTKPNPGGLGTQILPVTGPNPGYPFASARSRREWAKSHWQRLINTAYKDRRDPAFIRALELLGGEPERRIVTSASGIQSSTWSLKPPSYETLTSYMDNAEEHYNQFFTIPAAADTWYNKEYDRLYRKGTQEADDQIEALEKIDMEARQPDGTYDLQGAKDKYDEYIRDRNIDKAAAAEEEARANSIAAAYDKILAQEQANKNQYTKFVDSTTRTLRAKGTSEADALADDFADLATKHGEIRGYDLETLKNDYTEVIRDRNIDKAAAAEEEARVNSIAANKNQYTKFVDSTTRTLRAKGTSEADALADDFADLATKHGEIRGYDLETLKNDYTEVIRDRNISKGATARNDAYYAAESAYDKVVTGALNKALAKGTPEGDFLAAEFARISNQYRDVSLSGTPFDIEAFRTGQADIIRAQNIEKQQQKHDDEQRDKIKADQQRELDLKRGVDTAAYGFVMKGRNADAYKLYSRLHNGQISDSHDLTVAVRQLNLERKKEIDAVKQSNAAIKNRVSNMKSANSAYQGALGKLGDTQGQWYDWTRWASARSSQWSGIKGAASGILPSILERPIFHLGDAAIANMNAMNAPLIGKQRAFQQGVVPILGNIGNMMTNVGVAGQLSGLQRIGSIGMAGAGGAARGAMMGAMTGNPWIAAGGAIISGGIGIAQGITQIKGNLGEAKIQQQGFDLQSKLHVVNALAGLGKDVAGIIHRIIIAPLKLLGNVIKWGIPVFLGLFEAARRLMGAQINTGQVDRIVGRPILTYTSGPMSEAEYHEAYGGEGPVSEAKLAWAGRQKGWYNYYRSRAADLRTGLSEGSIQNMMENFQRGRNLLYSVGKMPDVDSTMAAAITKNLDLLFSNRHDLNKSYEAFNALIASFNPHNANSTVMALASQIDPNIGRIIETIKETGDTRIDDIEKLISSSELGKLANIYARTVGSPNQLYDISAQYGMIKNIGDAQKMNMAVSWWKTAGYSMEKWWVNFLNRLEIATRDKTKKSYESLAGHVVGGALDAYDFVKGLTVGVLTTLFGRDTNEKDDNGEPVRRLPTFREVTTDIRSVIANLIPTVVSMYTEAWVTIAVTGYNIVRELAKNIWAAFNPLLDKFQGMKLDWRALIEGRPQDFITWGQGVDTNAVRAAWMDYSHIGEPTARRHSRGPLYTASQNAMWRALGFETSQAYNEGFGIPLMPLNEYYLTGQNRAGFDAAKEFLGDSWNTGASSRTGVYPSMDHLWRAVTSDILERKGENAFTGAFRNLNANEARRTMIDILRTITGSHEFTNIWANGQMFATQADYVAYLERLNEVSAEEEVENLMPPGVDIEALLRGIVPKANDLLTGSFLALFDSIVEMLEKLGGAVDISGVMAHINKLRTDLDEAKGKVDDNDKFAGVSANYQLRTLAFMRNTLNQAQ